MTGTITFGGIGSGIDTEGIVTGLVAANSGRLNALRLRVTETRAAVTHLSDVGRSLNGLQAAARALATVNDASAYKVSTTGPELVSSISGAAMPGAFDVEVVSIAAEQRTYSKVFASNVQPLGQAGTLSIGVGTGTPVDIEITASDSLEAVASKINAVGLRVSASTFFDGTQYRLQVRGLDTGAANALTLSEAGTSLDLNGDGIDPLGGKTHQAASDAEVLVDGFAVKRSTNQIAGAIPGVTLAVTAKTTSPVRVTVATDPEALKTSLSNMVTAFNAVVGDIQRLAGFGSTKATDPALAGDSSLRSISSRLTSTISSPSGTTGALTMLAQLGISLTRTGTLSLDTAKLSSAINADPKGVAALVADKMSAVATLAKGVQDANAGALALRKDAMDAEAKRLDERIVREQAWLDRYAESLRNRFTKMDSAVAGSNAQLSQLVNYFG